MNKYVYLENYVNWETCGIQRGTLSKRIEKRPVLDANGNQVINRGKPKFDEIELDEIDFVPDDSAKTFAVRHLGKNIRSAKDLLTKEVFTKEVLDALDAKMGKTFLLPEAVNDDEFTVLDEDLDGMDLPSSNEEDGE
jgi:hypothetical protein